MEGHWEKEERTEGPESQERCVLLKPQSEESGGKERAGGHALQHTLPVGDTTLRPGGLGPVLPHCCHFKGGWRRDALEGPSSEEDARRPSQPTQPGLGPAPSVGLLVR